MRPSGESSSPASATTKSTRPSRSTAGRRWTSKCWVRLRMVGSTFCGSVVASTNTTWSGGSSSVFSSAFDAAGESMWTSSRMYTFVRPGRAERRLGDEVADGLDAVVRGGVELVDVEAGAGLDGEARGALAARLAVDRVLAVEDLGEDAGGGGLAGAAGPGEEVGVADPVLDHGVAQGADEVLLAPDLAEATGPVAAVERLVGHRRRAYRPPTTPAAAPPTPMARSAAPGAARDEPPLTRPAVPWLVSRCLGAREMSHRGRSAAGRCHTLAVG